MIIKWPNFWYERTLQDWQATKERCQLKGSPVPPHPDENPRSPNYLGNLGEYDFWRDLNIRYYHIFPELAEEHGWDIEKRNYKRRTGASCPACKQKVDIEFIEDQMDGEILCELWECQNCDATISASRNGVSLVQDD